MGHGCRGIQLRYTSNTGAATWKGILLITDWRKNKEHMDKVASDGMDFTIDPDQHFHLDGFKTSCSAAEIGIMDAVIFLTKATQLENAIRDAAPCIGPDTVLISLINGLGNDDKPLKYYPATRCMIGSGSIGTVLNAPGKCTS